MMDKTADLLLITPSIFKPWIQRIEYQTCQRGGFQLDKNALHIWPRGSFMIIALPNMDGSFTVTMFHPFEGEYGFNHMKEPKQVRQFFKTFYPELIPFMPDYVDEYFNNPTGSLGTVKCFPLASVWQVPDDG